MRHERAKVLIEKQFEAGPLPSGDWEDLRHHLRECDDCRAVYDRHGELEAGLGGGRVLNAARRERMEAYQLGNAKVAEVVPLFGRWQTWTPLLAIAAAVVLYVSIPAEPELVARGSGGASVSFVKAFYETETKEAVELKDKLPKAAPLLFTYTNGAKSEYRWVAIAGLDASGRAHWYYPEYATASQPEVLSVRIAQGVADAPMPDRVFAEHAKGKLEICALFSKEPLDVKTVDVALEKTGRWPSEVERSCLSTVVADE